MTMRLVLDLEKARKPDPRQMGMFGPRQMGVFDSRKPPGSGWQPIPRGTKGGFRRRKGHGWEYWYPETAKPQADGLPTESELWETTRDAAAGTPPETKTPGTNITWSSLSGWLDGYAEIGARRHNSKRYDDELSHVTQDISHVVTATTDADELQLAFNVMRKRSRDLRMYPEKQAPVVANINAINRRMTQLGIKPEKKPRGIDPMEEAIQAKEARRVNLQTAWKAFNRAVKNGPWMFLSSGAGRAEYGSIDGRRKLQIETHGDTITFSGVMAGTYPRLEGIKLATEMIESERHRAEWRGHKVGDRVRFRATTPHGWEDQEGEIRDITYKQGTISFLIKPDKGPARRVERFDVHKSRRLVLFSGQDLLKARRAADPRQMGLFGGGAPRPPGAGWQHIPGGRHGGFRRRKGKGWEYWYPDKQKVQVKPHVEDVEPRPKLVIGGADTRKDAVTDAMTEVKTKGKRKSDNELALEIVQRALSAGRGLTDEEAIQVAKYSGKGGISGDLNQYYTRTDVADAMWDVMGAYLPEHERVLEPSCGSGVFLQTAPKGTKVTGVELDSSAAMVADVLHGHKHEVHAQALEEFTIERYGQRQDFDGVIANPPYCVRTGDIPLDKPEFKSADKYFIDTSLDHVKDGGVCVFLIHPGVMSNRGQNWREFRERLLARAEVLDGFKLPDDCFKHVHCEIAADIMVLRKRDRIVGEALLQAQADGRLAEEMGQLGAWDQQWVDGTYFDTRPERILGEAKTREETGFRDTVVGDVAQVPGALRRLTAEKVAAETEPSAMPISVEQLAELGKEREHMAEYLRRAESKIAAADVPPLLGNVKTMANRKYLYIGEPPKWVPMETVDDVSQIINNSGDQAIKQAHDLAQAIGDLMKARQEGEFYKARAMRRDVATRVKAWVQENGIPGSHRALGELSRSAPLLLDFMACVDSNGELSDVLSKDAAVTLKAADVDRTDLASVAAYVARRNRGYVLPSDLQHNWEGWDGQSEDELRRLVLATGDYALDASARESESGATPLQHMEDYLTGNLYDKLEAERARLETIGGEERAQVQRQIAAIEERLETKRRSIDDIPIQLRVMGWFPLEWFSDFLNSTEGRHIVFGRGPRKHGENMARMIYEDGVYTLQEIVPPEGKPASYGREFTPGEVLGESSGGGRAPHFLKYMNRFGLKKEDVKSVEEDVERAFGDWLKTSEHRTDLENLYNRLFNSEFRKEYSGDALGLEGITEGIVPHDYQNMAVRWAAETGRGILGQDVGLGKTFIAILLARLRKQQGRAKRPMVVVPKSVATNWAEEVESLFPGSRVLVIGEHRVKGRAAVKQAKAEAVERGLEGEAFDAYVEANSYVTKADNDIERNRKLAMVKQNEYDLIICTKPAFDRIPLKQETIEQYEKEDFWYQRAGKVDEIREGSKTQQTQDKRIEKLKAQWAQDKLQQKFKHDESLVFWEDLGIDTLMADEAHAYKNLYAAKSRFGSNPKFLGGSGQSKQARKMQHMSHYVRESDPNNGVYLLTATPTKNSPLEVFNMLQHIAPEAFHKIGIENSEDFIDRFCQLEERLILTPPGKHAKKKDEDEGETQFSDEYEGAGNLESAQCVVGFTNLKELEQIMDRYMMLQTATDVGLKIPDAEHQTHLVDMTSEQKVVYELLRQNALNLDNHEDPGGMFRLLDQMKKAAQDLELYDSEEYKNWYTNSPKYKACVEAAARGAKERGGQIIFCDHNASHERLKNMLIEQGLKPSEIGIINAQVAADSAARQAIGNRFNRGEVKVVIGNTGTMGEGVNLQGKKHAAGTTDIHHLDQPWDPGTMHQRNGRGVRQGNNAEQVQIHTYLAKGSFDGFRHSTLKGKERWLDKLRSGADNISNDMEGQGLDDVEMLAMLSDNPDEALRVIKEKRATAESAWYAKQAQQSIDDFYNYQRKVERLGKIRGQDKARARMTISVDRLRRQLLRNELLPLEIKQYLESADRTPVAVNTYLTGEGDDTRLAARLIKRGVVIEPKEPQLRKSGRLLVERVDLAKRTIRVRSWGSSRSYEREIDQVAGDGYQVSDYKPADELKEALRDNLDNSWKSPLEAITHIPEYVLAANQSMIDEHIHAWYEKHGKLGTPMIVRTETGSVFSKPLAEIGQGEILYPWGEDKAALIEAVAEANTSHDQWREWNNPLLETARREYGYSSYGYGATSPFNKLAKEAEERWKASHGVAQ